MRIAAILALMLGAMPGAAAAEPDYATAMRRVAADIAALAPEFPQLARFSAAGQAAENLSLDYDYHTHRSAIRGGWRAAAPEPDTDGIWFALNFHDPDSIAQIDTQPVMARLCIGAKRVTFLILEGEATQPVAGRIHAILERHGVRSC